MPMTEPRDLGALIDAVKHANSWSDEDIVQRAAQAGYTTTKQNISRARHERPLRRISGEFMRALSAGLGVALVEVVRAALVSAELPDAIGESVSADWAIRHDPEVPTHMRRVLLTLLTEAKLDAAQEERRSDFAIAAQEEPGTTGNGESRRRYRNRARPRKEGTNGP